MVDFQNKFNSLSILNFVCSAPTSRDISLSGDIFVSLKTKKGGNFQTMVLWIFRGGNYV
jgi:hypothetical protein